MTIPPVPPRGWLPLTPRMTRVSLWCGAGALAVGSFIAITHKTVIEQDTVNIDRAVLLWMARFRTPSLTGAMVDLTALGSPTLVTVFTVVTFFILLVLHHRRSSLQLAIASLGTWLLTYVTKDIVERRRPTEVEHLVQVSGFSYPSGHSLAAAALYLTIAIVASGHLRSRAEKATIIVGAFVLIGMVGISRVYLGVHYPSDVASGVSLGTAWALVLAAVFSLTAPRVRQG